MLNLFGFTVFLYHKTASLSPASFDTELIKLGICSFIMIVFVVKLLYEPEFDPITCPPTLFPFVCNVQMETYVLLDYPLVAEEDTAPKAVQK